jgi:hypothetical protein
MPLARLLAAQLQGGAGTEADGVANVLEALEAASLHNRGEEAACPFPAAALATGTPRRFALGPTSCVVIRGLSVLGCGMFYCLNRLLAASNTLEARA